MKITYTIVSDTVTPDLKARLGRVQNPAPAMRRMGKAIAEWAKSAFKKPSKRPAAWPPLAARTLAQKKKKGYGSKPLIASGLLARSPRVISVTRNAVVVGSDRAAKTKAGTEYSLAAIHQLGAPRRHIPARPFFPFHNGSTMPEAKKQVTSILRNWLRGKG